MTYDERYEVQSADKQRALHTIATLVDEQTPDGMGFAVFLFDYGPDGALFYMSSAERAGVLASIKEWVACEERRAAHGH
jgi:hypothetical protein